MAIRRLKEIAANEFDEFLIGRPLSRKDAAILIAQGNAHIHSTVLGMKDAAVKATANRLSGQPGRHPWIPTRPHVKLRLTASQDRAAAGNHLLTSLFFTERTSIKENIRLLIEEMTSNAIYHSIRNTEGRDRYHRGDSIHLRENEWVELSCHRSEQGAYLSVMDRGGTLRLKNIAQCLQRCYAKSDADQIEKKESGAGLGFFMIFENTTHWDITVVSRLSTRMSVWIPIAGTADQNYFSFNYWGETDDTK